MIERSIVHVTVYLIAYGKRPHGAQGELFTNFGCLGASSGHLRGVSGRLGSVMGRLGGVLGASWDVLGASWGVLGRLGRQNRLGALLEPSWNRPRSVLGTSWGVLEASWGRLVGVLGISWAVLWAFWDDWERLGAILCWIPSWIQSFD